jgi:hypothetical protein
VAHAERRALVLMALDAIVFFNLAGAARARTLASASYVSAAGYNCVCLYLASMLGREAARGDVDADPRACRRLQQLVLLKFVLVGVLATGPHGARWFSPWALVWVVGAAELLAVLSGIRGLKLGGGGAA